VGIKLEIKTAIHKERRYAEALKVDKRKFSRIYDND